MQPGSVQNDNMGLPSSRLTKFRKIHEGRCNVVLWLLWQGASTTQSSEQNSGFRDIECHLGDELVQEFERYLLEMVGLTCTHRMGSGTLLLERG